MMRASGEDGCMSFATIRKTVRRLYEGATPEGVRFRYALLAFDIVTVLFIIATSFLPSNDVTETLDVVFGVVILADFAARLLVSRHRLRDLPLIDWDVDGLAKLLKKGTEVAFIERARAANKSDS